MHIIERLKNFLASWHSCVYCGEPVAGVYGICKSPDCWAKDQSNPGI
jgi:hypothetical protein